MQQQLSNRSAALPSSSGRSQRARCSRGLQPCAAAESESGETFDPRAFRRTLGQSEKYTRKHLRDDEAAAAMEAHGVGIVSTGAAPRA